MNGVINHYLGLAFTVNGETHFGWARLSVKTGPRRAFHALLTGYAYETVPSKPIITGQTTDEAEIPQASLAPPAAAQPQSASLGALALGSSGLSFWRQDLTSN